MRNIDTSRTVAEIIADPATPKEIAQLFRNVVRDWERYEAQRTHDQGGEA